MLSVFLRVILKCVFFFSQSLAWDKQEARFGGGMSVQKHSLHTRDLVCLCSVLHLKTVILSFC